MGGIVLLIGRVVFSFFFLYSGVNHLTKLSTYSQYAGAAGVPAPTVAVAVTGLMLLGGGLSLVLGVKPKVGAALLFLFLVPTSFMMHRFWGITDPMLAATQAANFWKNIALAGGALMIYGLADLYPSRWPYSVGAAGSTPTPL